MIDNQKENLTEEDKQFIIKNYNEMTVMQMAIRLNIKTENRKCSIITDFIRLAGLQNNKPKQEDSKVELKSTPPSEIEVLEKIILEEPTTEVEESSICQDNYETVEAFAAQLKELNIKVREPLSERERIDIRFLMNQMNSTRYAQIYKSYRIKEYKKLFQEEFIRFMYSKGEMPQEEVNDFIDVCCEIVNQYDWRCKIKELEKLKEKITAPEKIIGFVQAINELHDKITASTKRVGEIKKSLGALREQRVKDNRSSGLTVGALLEAFYDSEKRQKMIKLQDKNNKELMEALDKIDMLEETKALVMGISREELGGGAL